MIKCFPPTKTQSRFASTDNEAQGQSAKLVDANGVILCLNWHERLRDFHYLPKDEKTLVEILM